MYKELAELREDFFLASGIANKQHKERFGRKLEGRYSGTLEKKSSGSETSPRQLSSELFSPSLQGRLPRAPPLISFRGSNFYGKPVKTQSRHSLNVTLGKNFGIRHACFLNRWGKLYCQEHGVNVKQSQGFWEWERRQGESFICRYCYS